MISISLPIGCDPVLPILQFTYRTLHVKTINIKDSLNFAAYKSGSFNADLKGSSKKPKKSLPVIC